MGALDQDVSSEQLSTEYLLFTDRIKSIAPSYKQVLKLGQRKGGTEDKYDEIRLYNAMLNQEKHYKDIPHVLHLDLIGMCRTSCEAVVEGMASVTKVHNELRTSLDVKTVEAETIIRWQGLIPGTGKPEIYRASR